MYRLLVIFVSVVLIAGCGSLKTNDFLGRTGDALAKIGQRTTAADTDKEIQPLFEQPYIDPLTEYLKRHDDDSARAAALIEVRQERDRRCAAVAQRYNTDEMTETNLALYRRGYSFSCPQDVAAYEAKLEAREQGSPPAMVEPKPVITAAESAQPSPVNKQKPVGSPPAAINYPRDDALADSGKAVEQTQAAAVVEPKNAVEDVVVSRQLSDCYLLTRIRNFSAALKACRGLADEGIVGAQANMATIQSALGDHESAYRWARQAAPESGKAANLLGMMYAKGHGVAQDKEAAAKWFRTAAGLGHAGAENALDSLVSATAGTNAN